jgi:hypothetical protein
MITLILNIIDIVECVVFDLYSSIGKICVIFISNCDFLFLFGNRLTYSLF